MNGVLFGALAVVPRSPHTVLRVLLIDQKARFFLFWRGEDIGTLTRHTLSQCLSTCLVTRVTAVPMAFGRVLERGD